MALSQSHGASRGGRKVLWIRHRVRFPYLNIPPLSQAQAAKPHFPLPLPLTTGAGDVPSPSGTHWGTYRDIKKNPNNKKTTPNPWYLLCPPPRWQGSWGYESFSHDFWGGDQLYELSRWGWAFHHTSTAHLGWQGKIFMLYKDGVYIERNFRGARRGKVVRYRYWEVQEPPPPRSPPPSICGSAGRSAQKQHFVEAPLSVLHRAGMTQRNHTLTLRLALHQS